MHVLDEANAGFLGPDRGVHSTASTYAAGDVVTCYGHRWYAVTAIATTGLAAPKPSYTSEHWAPLCGPRFPASLANDAPFREMSVKAVNAMRIRHHPNATQVRSNKELGTVEMSVGDLLREIAGRLAALENAAA